MRRRPFWHLRRRPDLVAARTVAALDLRDGAVNVIGEDQRVVVGRVLNVVDVAPPAPYAEVVPVVPYAGAVWVGGYWGWSSGRHRWVPGYYERPRPGYRYEPHRWESRGGRWHLRGGGWVR